MQKPSHYALRSLRITWGSAFVCFVLSVICGLISGSGLDYDTFLHFFYVFTAVPFIGWSLAYGDAKYKDNVLHKEYVTFGCIIAEGSIFVCHVINVFIDSFSDSDFKMFFSLFLPGSLFAFFIAFFIYGHFTYDPEIREQKRIDNK